jgi:2-methylisocitrate lyase-like PEP mutase family enzyme
MRALIARRGYTMAPGAYDTLTARLVEQAGFEVVYLTGGGYSRANGYPDLGLLTLSENVRFIGWTVEAGPSRSSPMPIPATATRST